MAMRHACRIVWQARTQESPPGPTLEVGTTACQPARGQRVTSKIVLNSSWPQLEGIRRTVTLVPTSSRFWSPGHAPRMPLSRGRRKSPTADARRHAWRVEVPRLENRFLHFAGVHRRRFNGTSALTVESQKTYLNRKNSLDRFIICGSNQIGTQQGAKLRRQSRFDRVPLAGAHRRITHESLCYRLGHVRGPHHRSEYSRRQTAT